MSPCDLCHRDHWGTTCSGFPLMLLDDDAPGPECTSCGWGSRQTERCTWCRAEDPAPAALVRVVLPVLDELMWRRANAETLGIGAIGAAAQACDGLITQQVRGAESALRSIPTAAGAGPREPALTAIASGEAS